MEKYINEHLNEMIDDLKELVKFNSINNNDELPFGKENRKVLDKALELLENKGIKTKNLDYYAGYGEVGSGEKVIGIVSHLDIVPAGEGWDSNPFELTVKDNVLYGRGVSDDKGAGVAAMWAIKYLLDTKFEFKKRVRLIFGCNEETGSKCVRYYVNKEGDVDLGFTPDAEFPGIYAEKGMIHGNLIGKKSNIIDIKGGDASNIVCKKVTTTLKSNSFDENKLNDFFASHSIKYEINKDNDMTFLTVYGKAAHASMPDEGVNAINYLLVGLKESGYQDSFVDYFNKYIGLDLHGEKLGYESLKDEATNTSINIGLIKKENGNIVASLDMRFPIKSNSKACLKPLTDTNGEDNYFEEDSMVEPLFFDTNSAFIKALENAYRKVTKDEINKMAAIGGGTYAKAMKNIIAFGCEFQGENNHIHDANERLPIDSFKKQVLCYIEAIKNLNEVE